MIKKITILALAVTLLLGSFMPVFANVNTEEESTPTGIPVSGLQEEIDAFMEEHLGTTAPGAAIVVFHNGEIIFSGFYGYADLENGRRVDESTVFEFGSTGKLLTYVSVMQLVEQGLLDLDAPMSNYLPADFYSQLRHTEPFTMRDLLNHSAGFSQNMLNNFVLTSPDDLTVPELTLEEALLSINPRQIFSPGTGSAYSNFGIGLAGLAVEYVSGQPLYQYQWEYILNPVGMTNSALLPDWRDNSQILANKAQGYVPIGNHDFTNVGWFNGLIYPAGNINGTMEDLALFAMELMADDTVLFESNPTLDLMLSPSYSENGNMIGTYHGFIRSYAGGRLALGHGGNTAGFTTDLVMMPEENFGFVVSVNGSQEQLIIDGLFDLLMDDLSQVAQPVPRYDRLPSAEVVVGSYVTLGRTVDNFLEFVDYLNMISVEFVDENTILVSKTGGEAIFTQVEPYVFELTEVISATQPSWRIMNRIEFRVEDGAATHALVGGWDFTALPSGRTLPILFGSLGVVIASVLFLLITPIVLVVKAIRKKKRDEMVSNKDFARWQLATTLAGLAIILNNVIGAVRFLANQWEMLVSGINEHFILNYIFAIAILIFSLLALLSLKKGNVKLKSKLTFGVSTVLILLFIVVLINWNFFVLY